MRHNFGSRYASKPTKSSKGWDYSLVSKKIDPKNGPLGWRPGLSKLGQKGENMLPL